MMSDDTPLLKQYRAAKAAHPDAILMFRIGDFFEMFEADAETAARELELTLTSKAMGKSGRLPLAGVPHHSVESYIARLIRKGYHVAICDQTEDPKKAKGLVRREVTRIITPGTYSSGDGRENKFIASLRSVEGGKGRKAEHRSIAVCDLLTGEMYTGIFESRDEIAGVISRFKPAEIVIADDDLSNAELLASISTELHLSKISSWKFGESHAGEVMKSHFSVATLSAIEEDPRIISTVGALISYLKETQKSSLEHISSILRIDGSETIRLDASTLLQLEIADSPSRDSEATLLKTLDKAVTAMGSRLIARRLVAPLKNPTQIRARLELVEAFHADGLGRAETRSILKRVYDLERLTGKLALGNISPREVVALASSLEATPTLGDSMKHESLASLKAQLDPVLEMTSMLRAKLVETPPIEIGESPLFRDGVDSRLDEFRHGSKASREWFAGLQEKERNRTGISSLKVGFNNVFGYYIEVTKPNLDKVPADYIRKQTTSNAERFFTEELKKHEEIVLGAKEKLTELERELFDELRREIMKFMPRIRATANAVAEIDLSAAFAEAAESGRFVKPEILDSDEPFIRIEAGRHPVVEALLSAESSFVPNDTTLDSRKRFMLLTGPNMAGKSTYIRQVAVLTVMAQAGSFVPASRCVLSPFDGIFARIGASDRLARGLSTFMVEMIEAAMIMRGATKRSLVILDEIGRGTSTYDGLAIAWAIVESLSARGALTLFATHYHELTSLAEEIDGVFNCTVAVKEWGEKIHFLHEIRSGAADRSYGIQVAALAGVPARVLDRAKEILSSLEMGEMKRSGRDSDQLSLFMAAETPPGEKEVLEAVRTADPDSLSPRDALDLVVKLKEKLARGE